MIRKVKREIRWIWILWGVGTLVAFAAIFMPKHSPFPHFRTTILLSSQLFAVFTWVMTKHLSPRAFTLTISSGLSMLGFGGGLSLTLVARLSSKPEIYSVSGKWLVLGVMALGKLIWDIRKVAEDHHQMKEREEWDKRFEQGIQHPAQQAALLEEVHTRLEAHVAELRSTKTPSKLVLQCLIVLGIVTMGAGVATYFLRESSASSALMLAAGGLTLSGGAWALLGILPVRDGYAELGSEFAEIAKRSAEVARQKESEADNLS